MLNKALPTNPESKRFASYKTHPWATVPDDQRGTATAAGAYQFVHSSGKRLFDDGSIAVAPAADLFSPKCKTGWRHANWSLAKHYPRLEW
jgi:hypothetical protein